MAFSNIFSYIVTFNTINKLNYLTTPQKQSMPKKRILTN